MIPASPGAELFSFGSFTILWYSLFALVAACVGTWVILHLARRSGISNSHMIDTVFWVLLIGLVGARMYHVWNEWWWYKDQLFEIWRIWEGGIAIHGGIVFGLGALFMISRQKKNSSYSAY